MNQLSPQNDLVVLAADKSAEMALRGILSRPEALEIRPVSAEFIVHPEHDPGCVRTPHQFLRSYVRSHAHAIVVLDREGSGREAKTRAELEQEIEGLLACNGWLSRSAVIVLDPELETWVWSDSPEVDAQLGWTGRQPDLRTWLRQKGFLSPDAAKPKRPKETMQAALYEVRLPWSSSIHGQLAGRVSFRRCTDPSFEKLRTTLQRWFSKSQSDRA